MSVQWQGNDEPRRTKRGEHRSVRRQGRKGGWCCLVVLSSWGCFFVFFWEGGGERKAHGKQTWWRLAKVDVLLFRFAVSVGAKSETTETNNSTMQACQSKHQPRFSTALWPTRARARMHNGTHALSLSLSLSLSPSLSLSLLHAFVTHDLSISSSSSFSVLRCRRDALKK